MSDISYFNMMSHVAVNCDFFQSLRNDNKKKMITYLMKYVILCFFSKSFEKNKNKIQLQKRLSPSVSNSFIASYSFGIHM